MPDHDDRFIHRCQVRLCEDNQLYMLPSICLLTTKRILFFTHSLMLDSREKERRMVLLRLGFNGEERKEKCLLYHPVKELKIFFFNLIKTRSQFGTFSLENIVASIESPFICPSSTLRTKTTRGTI